MTLRRCLWQVWLDNTVDRLLEERLRNESRHTASASSDGHADGAPSGSRGSGTDGEGSGAAAPGEAADGRKAADGSGGGVSRLPDLSRSQWVSKNSGKWVCQTGGVEAFPTNDFLALELDKLADIYKSQSDEWRSFSYSKAAKLIRGVKFEVRSADDLRDLRGIGSKTRDKVAELLRTGRCARLDKMEESEAVQARYDDVMPRCRGAMMIRWCHDDMVVVPWRYGGAVMIWWCHEGGIGAALARHGGMMPW